MILTLTRIAETVRANVHPDQLRDLKVHPDCVTYAVQEIGTHYIMALPRGGKVCDMVRTSPDDDPLTTVFDDLGAYAAFLRGEV